MKLFIHYIFLNCKRQMAYKFNFFANLILVLVFYFFQLIFIEQLLSFKGDFSDTIPEYLILIFFVFSILSLSIDIFSSSIYFFFKTLAKGGIEPFLTKPVSIYQTIIFKHIKPFNIILILVIVLFIFYTSEIFSIKISTFLWFKFGVALFCSFILNILFIFTLNLLTFTSQRFLPIDYIHSEIFSLSIVPISLYPKSIINWIVIMLPIGLSSSLPVAILNENNNMNTLLIIYILITIVMFLFSKYLLKKALKKFNGLGG